MDRKESTKEVGIIYVYIRLLIYSTPMRREEELQDLDLLYLYITANVCVAKDAPEVQFLLVPQV